MPTANAEALSLPEKPAATSLLTGLRRAPAGVERPSRLKLVPPPETDAQLVERALREGPLGREAEEELYRRYRMAVHRLAATFLAPDADEGGDRVQEAFVRAFRALKGLKDRERFAAWLFTIARNRARSYLTARATHGRAV